MKNILTSLALLVILSSCGQKTELSLSNKTDNSTRQQVIQDMTFERGLNHESPNWENLIAEISGLTDSQVQNLNMPSAAQNGNQIYISTSKNLALGESQNGNLNKIYLYDLKSKALTELYTENNDATILATIGREDNKLIFYRTGYDYSPGPCASELNFSSGIEEWGYVYLDLAHPENGLKEYRMPEYLKELGQAEMLACEKEIFPERFE